MTLLALRIARAALRPPPRHHHYGSHPRQVADLHAPRTAGCYPVVVVLHGGYWQPPYTRLITRPLCLDLAARGFAAWNVGYRRLGKDGGGWPQTFEDVAAAIDHLAELGDPSLDLDRVTVLGHSAGGQLALWAGGRSELPAAAVGGAPRVRACRVLAMAAVSNLAGAGETARQLLGGTPAEVPERWNQADPLRRVPLHLPVALVHATGDRTVPIERSREYAAAARAAGGDITLVETTGEHRDPIDPSSLAWAAAVGWLSGSVRDAGA